MRSTPGRSSALHRAWVLVALRGVLAVVVSAVVLTRPAMARGLLIAALGSYLLVDGVLALGTALRADRGAPGRGAYILEGLISVGVGALALARPTGIAVAVMSLIAARAIIAGIVEVATAFSLRGTGGERYWPIALSGAASLGFGAFVLLRPVSSALVLVLLAGLYILLFGFGMIAAAFRLQRDNARLRHHAAA